MSRERDCEICGITLYDSSGLARHRKRKHPESVSPIVLKQVPQSETNIICLEPDCGFGTTKIQALRLHLSHYHGFQFTEVAKTFSSDRECEEWKASIENWLQVSFVRHRGNQQRWNGTIVAYYYCNRSGFCTSRKEPVSKKPRISGKLERFCTASMTIRTLATGVVKLRAVVDHYGHNLDLRHIRIPRLEREKLAGQILQGVPIDSVLESIQTTVPHIPPDVAELAESTGCSLNLIRLYLVNKNYLKTLARRTASMEQEECFEEVEVDVGSPDHQVEDWIEDNSKRDNLLERRRYEADVRALEGSLERIQGLVRRLRPPADGQEVLRAARNLEETLMGELAKETPPKVIHEARILRRVPTLHRF